jgi:hypothetical protein
MNAILSNPQVRAAAVAAALYGITRVVKDERVRAACYGAIGVIVLKQIPMVNTAL